MANEQAIRDNNISNSLLGVDTSSKETRRFETEEVSGQTALLVKDLAAAGGGDASAANQTTMITALEKIDDLQNALSSIGTDQLDVNIISGAGSGGTASDDDADFTAGTTAGTPSMGVYESLPTSVTDGDLGIVGIDENRRMKVSIEVDNVGIGGGTQYTEGDTDATITGTAIMWEDTGDTLKAISASNPLPIDGSGVTQPISAASLPLPSGAAISANQQTDALTDTELRNSSVPVLEDNSAAILADTTSLDGKDFATSAKQDTTNTHLSNIDAGKLEENTFTGRVGEVQASPTANTVLDRLKTIGDNQLADGHNVTASVSGGTLDNSDIDANNSTTTPLSGGSTFTGTGTDCEGYASVAITLYADVDSATDGMTFQFSTDNTNWDDVYNFTMDVSDSDTRRFQFPITAQYFRVVYTNGGSAQSAFRIQTILHRTNILTSIHRVSDGLTIDRSATLVRSVIAGETTSGGGSMVNVKVNPSGTLETNAEITEALPAGDNNIGNVDIVSSALPSGASTSANQSTIIGHVDGIEGLLTTIDTDTGVIAGDTTSIDGKTPSLGQTNKVGSVPVTLASDEDNVNVDIASSVALDVSSAIVTVDATGQGDVPITLNGEEVTVAIKPAGTVGNGQNTVASAGTAEALAGSTAIESVTIKALAGNSDDIYVGDSGVNNTNGFVLDAGETVSMDVDNLADIYIDADTNGDGVSYIYIT